MKAAKGKSKKLVDELREKYRWGETKRANAFERETRDSARALFDLLKQKALTASEQGDIALTDSKVDLASHGRYKKTVVEKTIKLFEQEDLKLTWNDKGCSVSEANFTLSGWADEDPKPEGQDKPTRTENPTSPKGMMPARRPKVREGMNK